MKNLNLTRRLAGKSLILLVLFAISVSGQVSLFPAAARILSPAEKVATIDQIVLLEGLPVSTFRLQLGKDSASLSTAQQAQVRTYSQQLQAEQQRFVESARKQGITLQVRRSFTTLLNGLAVTLSTADMERLAELPGMASIHPDDQIHLELADSVVLIGANQVWQMVDEQSRTVTGQGIRVAVIDTGVDYMHPDLGGCFGAGCKVAAGYDLYNNDADPKDDNGHGTHCAGIVAADGSLHGVAPGASLYAYKVLNASGSGSISTIIAGIERAADPDQDPVTDDAVDVISMSLGLPGAPDDPWPLAVDAAVEQGILVAVSAGNSGPDYNSMESPGLARRSLAVGAVDKSDQIALFSSRGPIPGYDGWLKPDLLAPGVDIVSTYLGGIYASSSGTSMAAPHAAGAAALVKQMHPDWTPEQIQSSLMNTATDLGLNVHTQGAGRLQVDKAVTVPGLVAPASVSFGTVDISQPLWSDTRLLWLENVTTTTRSYSLSVESALPTSVTASIEPNSLTLAPGEKGGFSVVLAVESPQTPPDLDRNEGVIRIQQGGAVMNVPFAFQMPLIFSDSRSLPFSLQASFAVALGDLDGDGDLDAFVGNTSYYNNPANTVWLNDGSGNFSDSGQRLGSAFTWDVALGDLDGDGDLDAFIANSEPDSRKADEVWLNNGHGIFTDSGQRLGNTLSRAAALGDLDGDGDLDAYIANGIPERGPAEADRIWLNNGHGIFTDSGQLLGSDAGLDVALGDLDGDGDLDAFIANGNPLDIRNEPNKIWLNNGAGVFSSSGQNLGSALSQAAALGDIDGDGDLDAFVANGGPEILSGQPDELWLNNGSGIFNNSGQRLGSKSSYGAALADLHKDGTLDVFVAGYYGGNRVWLNDGSGILTFSSPGFGTENAADVALGDVDGDGDIDALAANVISNSNRVWLNRGSGAPPLARLAPPSELAAVPVSTSRIGLTWTDNAADETSYRVERSPDGLANWTEITALPANATSYADTAVNCGLTYYYRVRAHRVNGGLYSAYSHPTWTHTNGCTAPAAPTNLTAVTVSETRIDLGWIDNAVDESTYLVERSLNGTSWVQVTELPSNTYAYSDSSLACGIQYYYRVRAYRATGSAYSDYSNTATSRTFGCPLPAPSNLTAAAVSQVQINLEWSDNAADETSYFVERSMNGVNTWEQIAALAPNATSYSNTNLSCAVQYYYRVRAYRAVDASYSLYSNIAVGNTFLCSLAAPSELSAINISSSQIDLTWRDNAEDETAYRVERSPDGVTNWSEVVVLPADAESHADTSLLCSKRYYYRVQAYREADHTYSAYSTSANATTNLCPLPTPTLLSATPISYNQINLAWIDNAVDETAYHLERSLDGATGWTQIADLPANTTVFSDSALSCAVQYFYRVHAYRAVDEANSLYSNTADGITSLCTLPAPSNLSANTVSCSQIDLTWSDNAADESNYRIERSLDALTGWIETAVLPVNSTAYSDTGLACGTEYHYRVRAYRESDGQYSQYSGTSKTLTETCDYRVYLPVLLQSTP